VSPSESELENRREYSRVYAYVPLAVRVVPPEERPLVHSRFFGETSVPNVHVYPDMEDTMLDEWLRILNAKLDTIIRLLTIQGEGFHTLPYRAVNISGSGIRLTVHEDVRLGDIIELKMIITGSRLTNLYLYVYAEVLKVEEQTSGRIVAARFIRMDDAIRDEIVRFVFEREREILREKRK